jgi:DNA-binding transcriptional regulator YdaS (Cro superfamily)
MEQLQTLLEGQRKGDFAKRIGVSSAYLSQLLSGKRTPSLEVAVKIERETGGAVLAASWVPLATVEHERGAA